MTQPPAGPSAAGAIGPLGDVHIGKRAARAIAAEFARHNGPKTGLLVGPAVASPVLAAAIDGLLPGDTLTVVAAAAESAELRVQVAGLGGWVAARVRVLDSIDDADVADVVMVAEPLVGTAEDARATLDKLTKYVADSGVLVVAVIAVPGVPGGATAELDRHGVLFGVGSDLVLLNIPPVRVHRLRFNPAEPSTATRLAPAHRPSSVPLTRQMSIDSNGLAAAGIALGLAALGRATRRDSRLWLLPALAAAPVAAFFRDPKRDIPDDPTAVVAASDGRVLSVQRVTDERFGATSNYLRIAVFLSVLDVHINRAPVAGRVADHFVEDGGFAAAMKPDAEHNVSAYTVLDSEHGTVVVAQRTGLLARRIVQRAPVGALLAKGERFGLIRFGSRTDVYLPADRARAVVAPGDRVLGGSSVIARWN